MNTRGVYESDPISEPRESTYGGEMIQWTQVVVLTEVGAFVQEQMMDSYIWLPFTSYIWPLQITYREISDMMLMMPKIQGILHNGMNAHILR